MAEKINLEKTEKKIHSSLSNDGTLDILLGLFLLGLGLSLLLADLGFGISEEIMLYTIIPAFVIYPLLLFFVTIPRRGIMRMTEKKEKSTKRLLMVNVFWLSLVAVAGLYFSLQPVQASIWNNFTTSLFWIAGSMVMFSIMAYMTKLDRFYIYGLVFATPFPFRVFMKHVYFEMSTLMFFIAAGIILATGTAVLIRFIKNTPKSGKL
jgi:hypothetical protein